MRTKCVRHFIRGAHLVRGDNRAAEIKSARTLAQFARCFILGYNKVNLETDNSSDL